MADSLAARRGVREHLETHFEEYLSSVSTYLRQVYPELQLSQEMSEEIAATVIVRVSHANPEPNDIEKALTDSADDVVRARRPRLSQARLLDEVNGPLRSEFPRALPSLRLVQTPSRIPPSGGDAEGAAAAKSQGRLLLANPPLDLSESIGIGRNVRSEPEPHLGVDEADEQTQPVVRSSAAVPGRSETAGFGETTGLENTEGRSEATERTETEGHSEVAERTETEGRSKAAERDAFEAPGDATGVEDSAEPDDEHVGLESGTLREVTEPLDSRVEARHALTDESAVDSAAAPVPNAASPRASEPPLNADHDVAPSDNPFAAFEVGPDERTVPSAPAVLTDTRSPEQTVLANVEVVLRVNEASDAGAQHGGAVLLQDRVSSVPPTQESIIPKAPSAAVIQGQLEHVPAAKPARTRRKTNKPAKKKTSTKKAAAKARTGDTRRKPAGKKAGQKVKPLAAPRETSGAHQVYVSDDLAVLAMMGFPANPQRAAKLCVTAMAEELGLDGVALSPYAALVTDALDALRQRWISAVPEDAPAQWQRAARQATLRAFLTRNTGG